MSLLKHSLALLGTVLFLKKIECGLRPYYIHFPPPPPGPPVFPVPNGLEPIPFPYHAWPPRNLTLSRNLPGDPIPLIVHTWVKPESSEGIKLQNGTLVYYVSPPWGGIRSSSPTSASPNHTSTRLSNSLSETDEFPTFSPGENEIERQSLFEAPNRQSGGGYANSQSPGVQASGIDITTPPPSKQGGPWGHGHSGFGWPTATQLYDKLPETTTGTIPTRSQSGDNSTTTVNSPLSPTTTTLQPTTLQATTTTTADPVAANTNARFPVSDSVRKFRRIVAQIRAITKKELGSPQLKRSRI